jgi:hypothetical protein
MRASIYSSSSWPGLTRPSTSFFLMDREGVDARVKPGHDGGAMGDSHVR